MKFRRNAAFFVAGLLLPSVRSSNYSRQKVQYDQKMAARFKSGQPPDRFYHRGSFLCGRNQFLAARRASGPHKPRHAPEQPVLVFACVCARERVWLSAREAIRLRPRKDFSLRHQVGAARQRDHHPLWRRAALHPALDGLLPRGARALLRALQHAGFDQENARSRCSLALSQQGIQPKARGARWQRFSRAEICGYDPDLAAVWLYHRRLHRRMRNNKPALPGRMGGT